MPPKGHLIALAQEVLTSHAGTVYQESNLFDEYSLDVLVAYVSRSLCVAVVIPVKANAQSVRCGQRAGQTLTMRLAESISVLGECAPQ